MGSRLAAAALIIPIVLATGFGVLLCLYLRVATCDEGCESSGSWHRDPGAWQWNLFLLLAVLGGIAVVVLFVAVLDGGSRAATVALVTWTTCAVALQTLLQALGYRHQSATGWFAIAILSLLGLVAIVLAEGRAPREARPSAG